MVRDVEPTRPSTRLSRARDLPRIAASRNLEPGHLLNWLREDIDWIVMKALEKDRDRRYETASGFAADIQRFLANEPVVARPPSRGYQLRKFMARNKRQVVAASLVIVALVAGIVGTTLGMVEARKQRDIAEREYRRARAAVDDSFVKVSENRLLNVPGMQSLRKELLGSARAYYQQFLKERALDPSLKADLARTQSRLGLIALALNQTAEALEAYRSAASMCEALAPSEPRVWRHRFDQAIALDRKGMLLLDETGRLGDAEKALRQSHRLFEALARSRPGDSEIHSFLAGSYGNLADVAARRGDNKTAVTLRRQCLEVRRKLLEENPDDLDLLSELALAEQRYATFAHVLGRKDEAREGFQEAVKLSERLVEKQRGAATARFDLSVTLQKQGRMAFEQGHGEAGRIPLERGLAIEEALVRENPLVGEYRAGLASAHNMMSDLDRAGESSRRRDSTPGRPAIFSTHWSVRPPIRSATARAWLRPRTCSAAPRSPRDGPTRPGKPSRVPSNSLRQCPLHRHFISTTSPATRPWPFRL